MTINARAVTAAATCGVVNPAIGSVEVAAPDCTPGTIDTALPSADAIAIGFAYRAVVPKAGRLTTGPTSVSERCWHSDVSPPGFSAV
jgi:hypothetical protein